MNKVELLNYIHWFSLKTQFKNTSGSVQLRLHNKPLPGWGGGRIRSSLRTVISHTRLLVAPNAAPHLLASSRLWYQRAPKRWIKVMWVTFAGRAFHFVINIEVWILFNQPSWNIHNQWGPRSLSDIPGIWLSGLNICIVTGCHCYHLNVIVRLLGRGRSRKGHLVSASQPISRENCHKFLQFCWNLVVIMYYTFSVQ